MNNPVKIFLLNQVVNFRLKMFHKYERTYDFIEEVKKVKKILIILPANDEYSNQLQKFIKEINQTFNKSSISTFATSTLRKNDLIWFGVPNEKYLNLIREEGFDLVIDANIVQDKVCSYLCALSGAQLRLNLSSGPYDHIYNLHFRTGLDKPIPNRLSNIVTYLYHLKNKTKEN